MACAIAPTAGHSVAPHNGTSLGVTKPFVSEESGEQKYNSQHSKMSKGTGDMPKYTSTGSKHSFKLRCGVERSGTADAIHPQIREVGNAAKPELAATFVFGDIKSHYMIGQLVGEGSFAVVHNARSTSEEDKRLFAVKAVVKKAGDAQQMERISTEVRVSGKMTHANVVRSFQAFQDTERIYIVMECLTGLDLFDMLSKFPDGAGKRKSSVWILAILSGVAYCHSNAICHRDIKPENFLFSSMRPDAQLKLIDFGLSREVHKDQPMTTVVGTLQYTAPEVILQSYSEKCDVWSAGTVAWLCCLGTTPFSRSMDKPKQMTSKILEGDIEFGNLTVPQMGTYADEAIDFNLQEMLKQMLVTDPEKRAAAKTIAENEWLIKTAATRDNACCAIS